MSLVDDFIRWLVDNGCDPTSVQLIESDSGEGNRLVSCTASASGGAEPLLRVPRELTMSRASAERTELGEVLSRYEAKKGALPQDEVLALHLMHERRKALGCAPGTSFWGPWLRVVPARYDATPFWSAAELEELRGTMCFVLTGMMQKQLRVDLEQLVAGVYDEGGESVFGVPAFTADEYHWAMGTVWSRAFGVHESASESAGAASAPDDDYVRMLVPLVDMINHKPGVGYSLADLVRLVPQPEAAAGGGAEDASAAVATASGGGGAYTGHKGRAVGEVQLFAPPCGVGVGEELSLHYGSYSNAKLAYSYGFALQQNPTRSIDMWFGVPPTDPNADLKRALLAAQPATAGGCKFDFEGTIRHSAPELTGGARRTGGVSVTEPFLAALRVVVMQPDELTAALSDIESGRFSTTHAMVGARNEAAALDLLHAEVRDARARLLASRSSL